MTTSLRPSRTLDPSGILATPERRVDGRDKVSGRMQYTADIKRPGMLWAAFATSPYAHARIRSVDVRAAREVEGVRAVLTADDIGRLRFGRQLHDWPVLAFDRVLMIGDRIAAVAAETREAAEEAARRVVVDFEELEPLLDPVAALAPGAPVLHPDRQTYYHRAFEGKDPMAVPHPNVQGLNRFTRGETDLAPFFAGAHRVFEHTFFTARQHAGYIEPRSTLVWVDEDGTIHVQTPNKIPFWLRHAMAKCVGVEEARIVVEPAAIGGDFGGKGTTIDEVPCYFLAKATGRPVRYVETYAEELGYAPTRHSASIALKTAVDRDGRFVAHASDVIYDGGAYAGGKIIPWLVPGFGYSAIPYFIPNYQVLARTVYTNQLPGAHVRAPADLQVFFAWEQHVDAIAEALAIDPIELRLRNLLQDGQAAMTGEVMREVNAARVLETLKREARYGEPLPADRGRGIALTCRHTPGLITSIKIVLSANGTLEIVTGVTEQGSGQLTMLQRVAAATLGIEPERIGVRRASTAEALADAGTGGSWVTHVHGRAVQMAATNLKAILEERSALTLREGGFEGPDGRRERFEDVAARLCAGGPVEATATYNGMHGPEHPSDFSFSGYAIEVAVDRETGAVRVLDATIVCDTGAIINPIGHQGQIDGGFAAGIGSALLEEITIDEHGKVMTLSLGEYKLPTIADMPPFRTITLRGGDGAGPFGAKMAGELSNTGVAPAIANAIHNAVGVRLNRFPLTSERVYNALTSKS
jgi:CO/xanthine dehydrogenase Mo-binding subunit